jgi:hypothetical protein
MERQYQNRENPSSQRYNIPQDVRHDDEISIIELWQILMRRKLLVLGCFCVCIVIGSLYAILKTPVFEATAKIRLGKVDDFGSLQNSDELIVVLLGRYGKTIADGIQRKPPFLKKIKFSEDAKNIIELSVLGYTPEQAVTFLTQIANDVINQHQSIYETATSFLTQRIQQIKEEREALQLKLDKTSEIFEALKQSDSIQASFIMLEQSRLSSDLYELNAELPDIIQKLSPPKSIPTEILGEIVPPLAPAGLKKPLIVGIASILGVIVGIMFAFFTEFLVKTRLDSSD